MRRVPLLIVWSVPGQQFGLWTSCPFFFFLPPRIYLGTWSGTMPAATVDHNQKICEVWANNLEEELKRIRQVIQKYNYIAMVSDALLSRTSGFQSCIEELHVLPTGHRVSRCGGPTYWRVQEQRRLSVPAAALQCGSAQDNPAWPHLYERTGRIPSGNIDVAVQF